MLNKIAGAARTAWDAVPSLPKISMTTPAPLPVYLIHHSADPEDYTFVFDMDRYLNETQGWFKRPVFEVYTGCTGISRAAFAQGFREAFVRSWEERKAAAAAPRASGVQMSTADGVFWTLDMILLTVVTGGAALVPIFFMWAGLAAVDKVSDVLDGVTNRIKGLNPFARKEEGITDRQQEVDRALAEMEIRLDPDLYVNYLGPGAAALDYELWAKTSSAWPLPAHVREQLEWTSDDLPLAQRRAAIAHHQ